jgi:hypothetical protein
VRGLRKMLLRARIEQQMICGDFASRSNKRGGAVKKVAVDSVFAHRLGDILKM